MPANNIPNHYPSQPGQSGKHPSSKRKPKKWLTLSLLILLISTATSVFITLFLSNLHDTQQNGNTDSSAQLQAAEKSESGPDTTDSAITATTANPGFANSGDSGIDTDSRTEFDSESDSGTNSSHLSDSSTVPTSPNKLPELPQYENKVIVLTYHHISDNFRSNFTISPHRFREHIEYIHDAGLQPISFQRLLTFLETGELNIKNAVLITFDDGYESFYEHAFPVLKEYQYPAVQFVVPGKLQSINPGDEHHQQEIPKLSTYQIQKLIDSRLVEIQSHTFELHFIESQQSDAQIRFATEPAEGLEDDTNYRGRLYVDLMMARTALEQKTGHPVIALSFPYGFYNDDMIDIAQKAGYRYAFTSEDGMVSADTHPFLLPRVDVGRKEMDPVQLQKTLHQIITTSTANADKE